MSAMLRPKRDLRAVVRIAADKARIQLVVARDAAQRAGEPQLVEAIEAALHELAAVMTEPDSQRPRVH